MNNKKNAPDEMMPEQEPTPEQKLAWAKLSDVGVGNITFPATDISPAVAELIIKLNARHQEELASLKLSHAEQLAEERKKANIDQNTKLPSHSHFVTNLAQIIQEREERKPTKDPGIGTVVFCDINHFKSVNEELGHQGADRIIKEIAAHLKKEVGVGEPIDFVARSYRGGDEFLIFMQGYSAEETEELLEEVTKEITKKKFYDPQTKKIVKNISLAFGYYELDSKSFKCPAEIEGTAERNEFAAKFAIDEAEKFMKARKKKMKTLSDYKDVKIDLASPSQEKNPEKRGLIVLSDAISQRHV